MFDITIQAESSPPHGAVIHLPNVSKDSRVTVQQIVTRFEGANPFDIDWRAELLVDDQVLTRSEMGRFDGTQWNFVFTGVRIPEQFYGIRYVARSADKWIPISFESSHG